MSDNWREEHYPWPDDPRRNPDWGTHTSESEQSQLLGAILDVLIEINGKLPAPSPTSRPIEESARIMSEAMSLGLKHD